MVQEADTGIDLNHLRLDTRLIVKRQKAGDLSLARFALDYGCSLHVERLVRSRDGIFGMRSYDSCSGLHRLVKGMQKVEWRKGESSFWKVNLTRRGDRFDCPFTA